jgi:hypothetical protein
MTMGAIVCLSAVLWYEVGPRSAQPIVSDGVSPVITHRATTPYTPERPSVEVREPITTQEEPAARESNDSQAGAASAADQDPIASVAATFLTDKPDLESLLELVRSLGNAATVDKDSVFKDEWNIVHGKLAVTGTELKGSFAIEKGVFRVAIDHTPVDLPSPFLMRSLYITFSEQDSRPDRPGSGVQFHPNTRRPANMFLAEDEERLVGWMTQVGPRGSTANPLIMARAPDGMGWLIGHSEKIGSLEDRYLQDTTPFVKWLDLLGPYAR